MWEIEGSFSAGFKRVPKFCQHRPSSPLKAELQKGREIKQFFRGSKFLKILPSATNWKKIIEFFYLSVFNFSFLSCFQVMCMSIWGQKKNFWMLIDARNQKIEFLWFLIGCCLIDIFQEFHKFFGNFSWAITFLGLSIYRNFFYVINFSLSWWRTSIMIEPSNYRIDWIDDYY